MNGTMTGLRFKLAILFCSFTAIMFANMATKQVHGDDQTKFLIDDKIRPASVELPSLDGLNPRPLSSLIGPGGNQADFVQNELILVTDDPAILNAFLARW